MSCGSYYPLGTYYIVLKTRLPVKTVVQRWIQVTVEGDGRAGDEFRHSYSLFQHNSHVLSQLVTREEFYFLENGLNHHYHPVWVSWNRSSRLLMF